ncbi:MAG: hypothetical protein WA989_08970 [Henriciella sp.]|uniref:hypothetical protein n=1 Tax=Henriciella sp. TaxID=1968823 RepID=UPI003C770367
MHRLKAMLAVAGLTSFTRRAATPKADYALEPIRRPLDESKTDLQDEWMFDAGTERAAYSSALNTLSASLERLRTALSMVSADAPIVVEAEPAMSLGAMSFDSDLFDGEPMMAGTSPFAASAHDALLFGDVPAAMPISGEYADDSLFQQAA